MADSLHIATRQADLEKISQLLKEGVSVEAFSSSGLTPLMVAASSSNTQVVEVLLQSGADVNTQAEKGTVYDGYTAVHFAAEHSPSLPVLQLLVERGGNVLVKESLGRFPLHIAALKGNNKAIEFLLPSHKPQDVNEKDAHGRTPLMLAGSQGHAQAVRLLIPASGSELNAIDQDHNSALHHCFQVQSQQLFNYNYPLLDGHYQAAFELVKAGIDLSIKNKDGDTALDVINESLADLLEVLSSEREKFKDVEDIEELVSLELNDLERLKVDTSLTASLLNAIGAYSKVKERELALRKTRGSCPFVDSSVIPEIRKFKGKQWPKEEPEQSGGFPAGFGLKPNHNQFGEYRELTAQAGEGVCPMGFKGPKPQNHQGFLQLSPEQLESVIKARESANKPDLFTLVGASALGAALFAVGFVVATRFLSR